MNKDISPDFFAKNRDSWNKRTEFHLKSSFYNMEGFLKGENSLQKIELNLIGAIKGKSILHLQCHFGQDTLSLARMGANVTGIDLSDVSIEKAKKLNSDLGLNANFICCNLYDLPKHLNETFDLVFTSYGAIGWLPDLKKWGDIISQYLKPGGTFILVEFHPFIWMFDQQFKEIQYSYFNFGPIEESCVGTYADPQADFSHETVGWNHHFGEVFNSIIQSGLSILDFQEYDYSPYNCLWNLKEDKKGEFRIIGLEKKIPLVYSILALKKTS
ncbi:MAG: class I SAM-dependent methyltransferase [Candidatus Riflebacteria bacterium]|nr:class I SAM-dependent methyltransferase [Candidatus Riflebacteria bacterium]